MMTIDWCYSTSTLQKMFKSRRRIVVVTVVLRQAKCFEVPLKDTRSKPVIKEQVKGVGI